jgi:hypothetical protein
MGRAGDRIDRHQFFKPVVKLTDVMAGLGLRRNVGTPARSVSPKLKAPDIVRNP